MFVYYPNKCDGDTDVRAAQNSVCWWCKRDITWHSPIDAMKNVERSFEVSNLQEKKTGKRKENDEMAIEQNKHNLEGSYGFTFLIS